MTDQAERLRYLREYVDQLIDTGAETYKSRTLMRISELVVRASAPGADLPSKYWQQALREHHRVRHDSPNFDTLCNCGLYWAMLDDWIGHVQSVAMKMAADAASAPVERPAVAEE